MGCRRAIRLNVGRRDNVGFSTVPPIPASVSRAVTARRWRHPDVVADAELPALAAEITAGALTVNATALPLSLVETAWNAPTDPGQRIVFTPCAPALESSGVTRST